MTPRKIDMFLITQRLVPGSLEPFGWDLVRPAALIQESNKVYAIVQEQHLAEIIIYIYIYIYTYVRGREGERERERETRIHTYIHTYTTAWDPSYTVLCYVTLFCVVLPRSEMSTGQHQKWRKHEAHATKREWCNSGAQSLLLRAVRDARHFARCTH